MLHHDIAQELRAVADLLTAQKDFSNALFAQRIARLVLTGKLDTTTARRELARYSAIARKATNNGEVN